MTEKDVKSKIKELRDREEKLVAAKGTEARVKALDQKTRSLYAGVKRKRRSPKRRKFLKGTAIYAAAALCIIIALTAGWIKFTGRLADSDSGEYISGMLLNTDSIGWKRLLGTYYPSNASNYSEAERVAAEVLTPSLEVGKITSVKNPLYSYTGDAGSTPVAAGDSSLTSKGKIRLRGYDLFSDGQYFATAVVYSVADGLIPVLGNWNLWNVIFDTGYIFSSSGASGFPETVVTIPKGAVLTVNGVSGALPSSVSQDEVYFDCMPGETASPACEKYIFDDIYYAPELSASLEGVALELVRDDENRIYNFKYPESYTHSITVTVPEGVDVTVGSALLTTSWASVEKIEGELGELDDGGTGTKPMLNVWTVSGLFGEPGVSAEVYGKQLKLLSSNNGNYIFETPAECKYTVTVTVPAGAQLTVNGRKVPESEKSSVKADPAAIGSGGMMLGRYDVYELGSIPQALPELDRYEFTGFLALPNITCEYQGTALEPASFKVSAYDVTVEYDLLPEDIAAYDQERISDAKDFAAKYIKYICGGGAMEDPSNADAFNANYAAILGEMIEGTAGYVNVMESYREVNLLKSWDSFETGSVAYGNYIKYTESCISCTLKFDLVTRITSGDETVETGSSQVTMNILQVNYGGSWRIWGFTYESTAVDEPVQNNVIQP